MPAKKYIVKLTDEERQNLLELTSRGEVRARVMKRAQILLKADEGMKDTDIVSALNTSRPTVEGIRKCFVEGNLEKSLHDNPLPTRIVQALYNLDDVGHVSTSGM